MSSNSIRNLSPAPSHFSAQSHHRTSSHEEYNYESHGSSYTTAPPFRSGASKRCACTWEGCNKRFERQNALDTHMNIHLEQTPFACPVPTCGRLFNVLSNVRRHLQTHRQAQRDGEFAQDHEAGGNEGGSGYFHRSRHDAAPDTRRPSSEHHAVPPAQTYYSSARRV